MDMLDALVILHDRQIYGIIMSQTDIVVDHKVHNICLPVKWAVEDRISDVMHAEIREVVK